MDEVKGRSVIVADICNTLFDSNTTFDFIKYCVGKGWIKKKFLHNALLSRKSPAFWLIGAFQKLAGGDYHKAFAVRLLNGRTVEEVNSWSESFFREYLASRKIIQTLSILEKESSSEVVLVSSTLYPIAHTIAQNLGYDRFIATLLEIKNNRYTGRITDEISGAKLGALKKQMDINPHDIDTVVSDNFTDKSLMENARRKIAVCYNTDHEKFWSDVKDIEILRISQV